MSAETPPPIAPGIEWEDCDGDAWSCYVSAFLVEVLALSTGSRAGLYHAHIYAGTVERFSGDFATLPEAVGHIQRELIRIRTALAIVPDPDGGA